MPAQWESRGRGTGTAAALRRDLEYFRRAWDYLARRAVGAERARG